MPRDFTPDDLEFQILDITTKAGKTRVMKGLGVYCSKHPSLAELAPYAKALVRVAERSDRPKVPGPASYRALTAEIVEKATPEFQVAFKSCSFIRRLRRESTNGSACCEGRYIARAFERHSAGPTSADGLRELQLELTFHACVGELLTFCEPQAILALFGKSSFKDLPGLAEEIRPTLERHLLEPIKCCYQTVAEVIKSGELDGDRLTEKETKDIDALAEHIIGVFTSMLQLCHMAALGPGRALDKLNQGGGGAAEALVELFNTLYHLNDPKDFRKWAFISLFHDIGKFWETRTGCTSKHDKIGAEMVVDWGILSRVSGLDETDMDEVRLVIGRHLEIGCHGPGDPAITRLASLFDDPSICTYITNGRRTMQPDRLLKFFGSALLMWTHDAGGTANGLATTLPFKYMRDVFEHVYDPDRGLACDRRIGRDRKVISNGIARLAKGMVDRRMGRIIGAWLGDNVKITQDRDTKCAKAFMVGLKEAHRAGDIRKEDLGLFLDRFGEISGANHLFNMLVHPIRMGEANGSGYKMAAKGFVLLTKAAVKAGVNELRAVNAEGAMELNRAKRDKMAETLTDAIQQAGDVKLQRKQGWLIAPHGNSVAQGSVKLEKTVDAGTGAAFLQVKIIV